MNSGTVRVTTRFRSSNVATARSISSPPDGCELAPARKPQPNGALVKALARAWRWQRMLDEGRFASVRELAEAERVSLSYTSRILRLTLLAPDIVERTMDGGPTAGLAWLLEPFPVEWEMQREQLLAAA